MYLRIIFDAEMFKGIICINKSWLFHFKSYSISFTKNSESISKVYYWTW